jgi:hypothetical protein
MCVGQNAQIVLIAKCTESCPSALECHSINPPRRAPLSKLLELESMTGKSAPAQGGEVNELTGAGRPTCQCEHEFYGLWGRFWTVQGLWSSFGSQGDDL